MESREYYENIIDRSKKHLEAFAMELAEMRTRSLEIMNQSDWLREQIFQAGLELQRLGPKGVTQ